MTQSQIAEAAGLSGQSHAQNIKAGRQKSVQWEVGERLLMLYNPRIKPRKGP